MLKKIKYFIFITFILFSLTSCSLTADKIELSKTEVEYVIGEVDFSNVTIKAYLEDGTTDTIVLSKSYINSSDLAKLETVGTHNITVNCYGVSAPLTVIIKYDHEHIESDWIIKQEPTCAKEGLKIKECTICQLKLVEESIAMVDHDLVEHEALDATCTEPGYKAYVTCNRCDYTTYEETKALDHDLVEHESLDATCTKSGHKAYVTCSRCDYTTYEETKALDHDLVEHESLDATCTKSGHKAYVTCNRCDYTTYEETKALDHDLVDHESLDATCTEPGYKAYVTCSRCDYTTYEETKALDHDLVEHEALDATCTEPGYKAYETCNRCDYTTYEETKALGHSLSDWNILINATAETDGLRQKHCLNCEEVFEEEIIPCTNPTELTYTVNDDNQTCTVTGLVNSSDTVIIIPSSIDGYKVTVIGSGAFSNKKTITKVVMQDSVEVISATAFNNCTKLAEITLSKNLTNLGTGSGVVFNQCKALKKVYYRGTIEEWCNIKISAEKANPMSFATDFYMLAENNTYKALTSIVIPDSIKEIAKYQFVGFDKVTSLDLGKGVVSVGLYAFKDCTSLSNVVFSENTEKLYMGCFYNTGLVEVVLPDNINTLGNKVFQACKMLKTITISKSVELLPDYALYGCASLETVIISNSVKQIGDYAFNTSTNIKNVYFTGTIDEWNSITVNMDRNAVLAGLTITYNYKAE